MTMDEMHTAAWKEHQELHRWNNCIQGAGTH
jgi:hypothetical protein